MEKIVHIKNTIAHLYRIRLKKYIIFRALKFIYFKIYFYYEELFYSKSILISYAEYIKYSNQKKKILFDEYLYQVQEIDILPSHYQDLYEINVTTKKFPEVYYFSAEGAIIHPLSSFIFLKGYCLHNDLINFNREELWEFTSGLMRHKKNKVYYKLPKTQKNIAKTISLVNPLNSNYAHFLVETLPKLSKFIRPAFSEYKIIINEGLHKNIYEALEMINDGVLEIIKLAENEYVISKETIIISPTAHVVFNHKNLNHINPLEFTDSFYNLPAIQMISDLIKAKTKDVCGNIKYPDIIYFERGLAFNKKMLNLDKFKQYLSQREVSIFNPMELSFKEQVRLIANCKTFVTHAGASLASLIFASESCHILAVAGWSANMGNCHFFINLIHQKALKLQFVVFEGEPSAATTIHKDYYIDFKIFDEALRS